MLRVGVLGSAGSWYVEDLQRAARQEFEVIPLDFASLCSRLAGGALEVDSNRGSCASFDAILVRTMPLGSLEQIIFRMNALHLLSRQGVRVINSPRSLEIAIDKYLTSGLLTLHQVPTPPTIVCQKLADANAAFQQLGRDVVIKPVFGGEGRGICRVSDAEVLHRVVQALLPLNAVIYLQPYIEHFGHDIRVLFIGEAFHAMRRTCQGDWRTNISQGGKAEAIEPTMEQLRVARAAASITDASVVAVDILPARDGTEYVLEVNAVPGWKALAEVNGVDIGREILEYLAVSSEHDAR